MLVAITGTPGVGKSTVSSILRRTYRVIDIHSYAEEHDLFEEFDEDAGSYDVDVEKLNESVMSEDMEGTVFIDGHLSHFIDVDLIIVLRCDPRVIYDRLKARATGWTNGSDHPDNLFTNSNTYLSVLLSDSISRYSSGVCTPPMFGPIAMAWISGHLFLMMPHSNPP